MYTKGDFHSCNELYRTHGIIDDVYLNEKEISSFLVGGNLTYL